MPILEDWDLKLDADAVLRGQGADPNILRSRRPKLVEIAEETLRECLPLIQPRVTYERYAMLEVRHNAILLEEQAPVGARSPRPIASPPRLRGEVLVKALGSAREVLVVICTVGAALEELASRTMEAGPEHSGDMVRGLAIYGVGSAAVEALANAVCQHFEHQAAIQGWQTSIPLNPGMLGWSVPDGQPQIFSLVDGNAIGVQLSKESIMLPLKSLSMIIGQGPDMARSGTPCDYCSMQEICKYRTT